MNFNTATNKNKNKNTNKIKEPNVNISTWIKYEFKDGKIKCLNPPTELNEKEKLLETVNKISRAIENNRNRYITKYDELHGEGSYERYNCPLSNYCEYMTDEEDNDDDNDDNDDTHHGVCEGYEDEEKYK